MYEPMNNGERLYQRSRVNQMKKDRKSVQTKRKITSKAWEKYTLKPKINQWS